MDGCRTDAALAMPLVESNREENVRRLRPSISDEGLIRRALKVGIVKIDIGEAVTRRRQVDQPASRADKRRNLIHQHKVAQVIGAKLRLEAVRRMSTRHGGRGGSIVNAASTQSSVISISSARESCSTR